MSYYLFDDWVMIYLMTDLWVTWWLSYDLFDGWVINYLMVELWLTVVGTCEENGNEWGCWKVVFSVAGWSRWPTTC